MSKVVQNQNQTLIGIAVILLGALVYLLDRPPWQTTWFPDYFSLYHLTPQIFGPLGGNLPSFFHVFGFGVLTAGIIARRKSSYCLICGLWTLVNVSFEFLQADMARGLISRISVNHVRAAGLFKWLQSYSLNAVFDIRDISAIVCGAICAYGALLLTQGKGENNE